VQPGIVSVFHSIRRGRREFGISLIDPKHIGPTDLVKEITAEVI